jgi:hypothetical protein
MIRDSGCRIRDAGCGIRDGRDAGGRMKSYRDLDVYREAHELGLLCHKLSMQLPKYEHYETGSQLRRSSKSVSANIVGSAP